MNATPPSYPLRLEGTLAPRLNRGLWLVKWLLAIPHFIVLVFLWIAFAVVTVIAFFAILFTGRYPISLYDFVLGMNRWVLRVVAYAFLMTDEYPPFRLDMGGSEPATDTATSDVVPPTPAPAPS